MEKLPTQSLVSLWEQQEGSKQTFAEKVKSMAERICIVNINVCPPICHPALPSCFDGFQIMSKSSQP